MRRNTVLAITSGIATIGAMLVRPTVAGAVVLCEKKSGAVVVRRSCNRKETELDLAQFGAVGPTGSQGPAGSPDTPAEVRAKFFAGSECPGSDAADEMVRVGTLCIDRYEASVWNGMTGGTQYGATGDDYPCADTGNDCTAIWARSVAGVTPSHNLTWFQAAAACRNAGKRLLTAAEWQAAALGTPDPGASSDGTTGCRTAAVGPGAAGGVAACQSSTGVFDMVGNLSEYVAEWSLNNICAAWSPGFGEDDSCFMTNPTDTNPVPIPVTRGGSYNDHEFAGVFAWSGGFIAEGNAAYVGFRCAR